MQFRRACPEIACSGKKLEQVISADVVFAQEFVMVKLTQLGEQDESDGKRGKTGGLRGQPKFSGGVQQQEGDGDVFIDDVGDEYGVFQTAFFKGFRAQKDADAHGYEHDRRHVQMHLRAQQVQIAADGIGRLKNGKRGKQHQQGEVVSVAVKPNQPGAEQQQHQPIAGDEKRSGLRRKRQQDGCGKQQCRQDSGNGFQTTFIARPFEHGGSQKTAVCRRQHEFQEDLAVHDDGGGADEKHQRAEYGKHRRADEKRPHGVGEKFIHGLA